MFKMEISLNRESLRMYRFRFHKSRKINYRLPLISLWTFFGIIIGGSLLWKADANPQKVSSHSAKESASSKFDLWNDPSAETSTALMRPRSADHLLQHHPSQEDEERSWSTTGESWSTGDHVSPTFDESTPKNITTQLGQTAYLHCIVNNLGDKTVSWIRRKDFHVLTVGLDIYTSDERFQAIHIHNTDDWALQIRFSQLRDEGIYECQVSSDPKISYFVNLTVLVAKAAIEGAPDLYVKSGSSINLTCIITQSPVPPVFVFWYHDDRMINYDSSRGQIAVLQKGHGPDTAVSKLSIVEVQPSDSGNYTCCPSNAEATSITVHVLNGEKPAAMQHDANPGISLSRPFHSQNHVWLCVFLLLWVILR